MQTLKYPTQMCPPPSIDVQACAQVRICWVFDMLTSMGTGENGVGAGAVEKLLRNTSVLFILLRALKHQKLSTVDDLKNLYQMGRYFTLDKLRQLKEEVRYHVLLSCMKIVVKNPKTLKQASSCKWMRNDCFRVSTVSSTKDCVFS